MERHEDSRYERTEADLQDAFQILAGKKELNKISVSEITKLTGITRSTFYNHYVDMPTFIDAMEDRIVEDLFALIRQFHPKTSSEISHHFFICLCRYIKSNPFLIRIFATPHATTFIEKALDMFHRYASSTIASSHKTGEEQTEYAYAISYAIGGVVGILHNWTTHQCDDAPELTAACLNRAFLNGMKPWLS